jgi:colanic acid/amylovoran biosynthesis glycosyltransferase
MLTDTAPRTGSFGCVGHTLPEYLPRSATFIYTLLRFQQQYDSVVLARRTANLADFPLDAPVLELDATHGPTRAGGAFSALLRGRRDAYVARLLEEADRHSCVLLHAHFGWSGPSSLRVARELGIPLVTTFYGRDLADRKRRWQRRPLYEELFAEGDLFVCEGSAMAEHLHELGCPAEKVRIVRIGIDLSLFPFRPPVRTRPLVAVQVGRLVEKKGFDVSIRALASATKRLGGAELWIVGDGELRPELERLASSLGVGDAVRFLGEVSHDEYRELLDNVHFGSQPSRTASDGDTEGGAPTVLLEMQARGIPVVGTRHADIPEVVAAQDCLVEEGDAEGLAEVMIRLAQAPDDEWSRRAHDARRLMESQHDATITAASMEAVYTELTTRVGT